jgi:hypothetical protein
MQALESSRNAGVAGMRLEHQDRTLVRGRAGRWFREIFRVGECLRQMIGDLGERPELGGGDGTKYHFVAMLLDKYFGTGKSERLGQPNGLAASVFEKFGRLHRYRK